MASTIQISDLKLDEIKSSLVNFLKTTDTFKDYDFEGSGIRTLVDLLAYNTFYYGYYCNMMANEMFLDTAKLESSIISLTKPLGYVVTNRSSATCNVKLDNLNEGFSSLSAYSKFSGFAANGSLYYFYNLEETPIQIVSTAESSNYETNFFPIYEGALVRRQEINVSIDDQKYLLINLDVDPKTISIETQSELSDGGYDKWINYLVNPDVNVTSETKVFFIERKKNGYAILFGKQSETGTNGSFGKQITENDTVYITYLNSSGSVANNISNLNIISDGNDQNVISPQTITSVLFPSKNGRSTADIEAIRFFAPKTFARQNRLVTKGDYYALLHELGFGQGGDPDTDFKVFGGEEASPPQLGKVFISVLELNPADAVGEDILEENNRINELMAIINENSIIAVTPTYLPPLDLNANLQINASIPGVSQDTLNIRKNQIITALIDRYGTQKYNNNIIKESVKDICKAAAPGLVINDTGVYLYATIETDVVFAQQKTINFKNKIDTSALIGNVEVRFGTFKLMDVTIEKKLYKYNLSGQIIDDTTPVGELNYETGIITLYENLQTSETFSAKIRVKNDDLYGKDEFIVYLTQPKITLNLTNT
jgi:hypothetical protein